MYLKSIAKTLLLFLCILLAAPASLAHASEREPAHILLVYDSLAKGTSREGNIEALKRLLAAYGAKVTLAAIDNYEQGDLQNYTKVVAVRNIPDLTISNQDYIKDFETYAGGYLHVGEQLPAKLQRELNIRTQTVDRAIIRLSIGQYSQSSIRTDHMFYIEHAAGTAYGAVSSSSGDLKFPYGVSDGRFAYVPYFQRGNLSELAMAYLVKDWLGVAEQGKTYLVFKEIYPFSDLQLLKSLADKLYNAGIPFMVSVRPVFSNTDYPAMKRYLETLKYVQSRNGSILVNAPVVAETIAPNDQTLGGKMATFVNVLAEYGLAPLGIGTDMYWSYDRQYAVEGMGAFDSVVLFPDEKPLYRSQSNTSRPFASSLYSMQMDFLRQFDQTGKAVQPLPMDTALTYDFFDNEKQLDQTVQDLSESWMTFADYKYGLHTVRTEANIISSHNGVLLINDKALNLNDAFKNISSDYLYKQEEQKSFTTFFNIQNKIFIVAIFITLLIFGLFFIVGYRKYKHKYFK